MLKNLETEDLIIRPFSATDVNSVYRLGRESSLAKWIPDQVYKDEAEAADTVEFLISQYEESPRPKKKPLVLGIELKKTKTLIGHVGLSPFNHQVEIGYAISEEHCGKGYATQAVGIISKWALTNLAIDVIFGVVACENVGSARVLEKSGYGLVTEFNQKYLGKMRLCRKYLFGEIKV